MLNAAIAFGTVITLSAGIALGVSMLFSLAFIRLPLIKFAAILARALAQLRQFVVDKHGVAF